MRSNAYAERWVLTIRAEVTDRMLITGPGTCTRSWAATPLSVHYNQPRPCRALNLRPPSSAESAPAAVTDLTTTKIRRRSVLGGLINAYEQAA